MNRSYISVLTEDGRVRDDLPLPSGELRRELLESFEAGQDLLVCVLGAMDTEAVISIKSDTN